MKITHEQSFSDKMKRGLADRRISLRSVVAILLFGMIVLVFVLSDLTGRQPGAMTMGQAAQVNGEIISLKDFTEEENRMSQYYAQLFGGQFDLGPQQAMLRGEVMNTIVTKTLTAQAAEKEGIYATDAEVRHMITQELPYFKRDGHFQSDTYKGVLEANRLTPGEFENKLRQDIKNQRSRQLFESSLMVSDMQKDFEKALRSSKINLDFVQLSSTEFAQNNKISSEQLTQKWADADFAKKVEDNFKANQSLYETQEQVRASHILVKAEPGQENEALKKAQALVKRLEKEDFGKVAAQVSDDPGSKAKNGDLGYFTRERMVKEFADAAFTLPVGKVSEPVKSNFGYHIIKVTDKKAYAAANYDQVKNQIAQKLMADEQYLSFVKEVEADLAAGQLDKVNQSLAARKMTWKETGYFDLASEVAPLMNSSQAIKMALELTKADPMAKRLVREGEVQFLVRLKDLKVEASDVKAQDQELLERQTSMEAYRSWIENFKKSARIETNTALLQQGE